MQGKYIPTEFIIEDKDYEKFNEAQKTALKLYFKGLPFPEKLEEEINKAIEKQKGLGYGYSEIRRENVIHLSDIRLQSARFKPYTKIILPHAAVEVPGEYSRATFTIYYTSPDYTKNRNSEGAALEDLLRPYFIEAKARKAAQEAQEAQEREERARIRAEEEAKKEAERQARQAAKKPEEDFIKNWIEENGSERLKKAIALGLKYTGLFKREWTSAIIDPEARVFVDKDWIKEFEPGTPTLEQMEAYEAAINKANSIKEFSVTADLSEVSIQNPEEPPWGRDEEDPATALAIVYEVQAITLSTFWIVQYI